MEFSTSDKAEILLNALNFNVEEIHRREEGQLKLFEWSTALLLAAFGAVVALAGRSGPLNYPVLVKALATALITVPIFLFTQRIITRVGSSLGNAEAIQRIEETLRLFEDGYYGAHSPYPPQWRGNLGDSIRRGKMRYYYAAILVLMTACVVTAIWVLL